MPRGVKATPGRKPAAKAPAAKSKPPVKAATPKTVAPKAAPRRAAAAAPVVSKASSKDDLRDQIEKLERANAALRVKNKAVNKMAKAAAGEIAALQDRIAELESALSPAPRKPARGRAKAAPVVVEEEEEELLDLDEDEDEDDEDDEDEVTEKDEV